MFCLACVASVALAGLCLPPCATAGEDAPPQTGPTSASTPASAAAPVVAGLGHALEQAWRLHPQAAALDARMTQLEATEEIAGSLTPEPGAVSVGSLNDRLNRNLGKQEWEVEFATPLWLPGQRDARRGESASALREAVTRRDVLRLALAGELREAWWSLAAARAAETVAIRRREGALALEADVARRHKAGELSRIDANLAQSERLTADAELLDAQTARHQAEQAWQALTGLPPPESIADETMTSAARDAASGTAHPLLAAATATVQSARDRLLLAENTRREAPELALRVATERANRNDAYANAIGVKLKIPFSSAPLVRRNTAAAEAELREAEASLLRTQARLRLEADKARQGLEAAEQHLRMATEQHALARDNLQLGEKAFTLGEANLASLLRLRLAAFDTESRLARLGITRAAAVSRVNQALGVLP